MKIKLRLVSTNNLSFLQIKPWLGLIAILAISLMMLEFVALLHLDGIKIALAVGVILGIVAEGKFDPETLFVGGSIGSMVVAFILMLLLVPLPHSLFESCFILTSTAILVAIASIMVQWLIRNWICRHWGNFLGISLSAVTIFLSIVFSQLLTMFAF